MHTEVFHGEMSRWLYATFRRFGKVDGQAFIYMLTGTCMYAYTQREKERNRATWQGVKRSKTA